MPDTIKIQVWDLLFGGAGSALHNAHGVPVEAIEALAKKNIDLVHVRHLLDAMFDGTWVTKGELTWEEYRAVHYNKHRSEWTPALSPEEYQQKAVTLMQRRDSGVELYYQEGYDTLVVYDRTPNEFVSGTKDGFITTYFVPNNGEKHYVDVEIANRLIRVN